MLKFWFLSGEQQWRGPAVFHCGVCWWGKKGPGLEFRTISPDCAEDGGKAWGGGQEGREVCRAQR